MWGFLIETNEGVNAVQSTSHAVICYFIHTEIFCSEIDVLFILPMNTRTALDLQGDSIQFLLPWCVSFEIKISQGIHTSIAFILHQVYEM